MDFEIARPLLSGLAGGVLATFFCMLLRRWVPEVCNGKDSAVLIRENRVAIWVANSLFFCGIAAGIAVYQLGLLPNSDWRGLALGVGGGSGLALSVLFLFALARGNSPKEAYVAFAIAQSTPSALLYGILMLSVATSAAAVTSLLADSGW